MSKVNKCIFINGPPGSGKDTAAELLAANHDYLPLKFAGALKAGLAGLLGMFDVNEYNKFFETHGGKESHEPPFTKTTPRQTLIDLSEEFMKPRFGKDIFGQVAARTAAAMGGNVVFSDCGFAEELLPVVRHFGETNCLLIKLYREGCSFEGDSRRHISPDVLGNVYRKVIRNDGSIGDLYDNVALAARESGFIQ